MRAFALLALPLGLVAGQGFPWLNTELSEVISYEQMHYTQCSQFPQLCPPVAQSCAQDLCANCPKYYHICCAQSSVEYASCFASVSAANGGGGGGGIAASATAAPTAAGTGAAGTAASAGSGAGQGVASATAVTAATSPSATHNAAVELRAWRAEIVMVPVVVAVAMIN